MPATVPPASSTFLTCSSSNSRAPSRPAQGLLSSPGFRDRERPRPQLGPRPKITPCYARGALRTMFRRPREPCSSKTSSVVSRVQRRFKRFDRLMSTSISNLLHTYSMYVITHAGKVKAAGRGHPAGSEVSASASTGTRNLLDSYPAVVIYLYLCLGPTFVPEPLLSASFLSSAM